MKKLFLALLLAVPLAIGFQALYTIASDIVPGQDVKSAQPVAGVDSGGKARTLKVGTDGTVAVSGSVSVSSSLSTAAKGATASGSPTSTAASADRQLVDVILRNSSGTEITSFGAPNIATAQKGATAAGSPTSTTASSARQPLDVTYYDSSGNAASTANPIPVTQSVGGAAVTAANPVPVAQTVGGVVVAAATPVPTRLYDGSAAALGTTVNPIVTNMRVGYVKTGAPSFAVSTSTTSASATSLTAGACYRVACSAATFFRSGTGSVTALTTDNALYGPTVEKICIPSTDTVLAFVNGTGTGTCTGTLYAVTP